MFMTQNHTELLVGKPFGRDRFWSGVELAHDDIWFYVSTAFSRVGGSGKRNYLFTKPSDLASLIDETDELFWIEHVMAVVPPRINGSGCWTMQQLKELVALSVSTDLPRTDYVYKLENGIIYETRESSSESAITRCQTLYSDERHSFIINAPV